MGKRYKITSEQKTELETVRKETKEKNVARRLRALILRAEGRNLKEIGLACEYHWSYVSQLVATYCTQGLSAIVENHYTGNRRNMSIEEEAEFLSDFKTKAEQGQIVEVSDIAAAYEKKVGHSIGSGQIYYVLARHGWRKVMPRSEHPNKASDEDIEASKKLTQSFGKPCRNLAKIKNSKKSD